MKLVEWFGEASSTRIAGAWSDVWSCVHSSRSEDTSIPLRPFSGVELTNSPVEALVTSTTPSVRATTYDATS